jgi:hypothetical protein
LEGEHFAYLLFAQNKSAIVADNLDSVTKARETNWDIHFYAVPSADGTAVFVSTGQTTEVSGDVNAGLEVAGAAKRRFLMTYSTDESAYEVLATEIVLPGPLTVEGDIALTADLDNGETLDTGEVDFRRFFVPTVGAAPLVSTDNTLEMTLSDHSLPADAYALVMGTNSSPGPITIGHQLLGKPYSVRPSGAIISSTKPMLLKLFYTDTTLGSTDPHTLSLLEWDPVGLTWDDLGGVLDDLIEGSVTTTTDRFTVYALMSVPRWRDILNDFTGLSEWEHVTILLPAGRLVLDGLAYSGTATSRTITPTVPIKEWGEVNFDIDLPAGTGLTIDVLGGDGTVVLSDVSPGMSLAVIDPIAHPSLKLRATFTTTDLGLSASLNEWSIDWEPESSTIHIPFIVKP